MTTLQTFLGQISTDQFFSSYLDRRVLHVSSAAAERPAPVLLSTSCLERLLSRRPLSRNQYLVIADGTVDPSVLHGAACNVDEEWLKHQHAIGATLCINDVHRLLPRVRQTCHALAKELGCWVGCNMYVTPSGCQGFKPHYDDHDLLVLQCFGSKRWTFHDSYSNKVPTPLRGMRFNSAVHIPNDSSESILLEAGDVLYVPRGHMHSAEAQGGTSSTHLTFCLDMITWADIMFEAMARSAVETEQMRGCINRPTISPTTHSEELGNQRSSQVLQFVLQAINQSNVDDIISHLTDASIAKYELERKSGLVDLIEDGEL